MRKIVAVIVAAGMWVSMGGWAQAALPSSSPDSTGQTDGIVRAVAQVGNLIWVSGRFTHVLDASGNVVETVSNLAAFDATTGADATPPTVAALGGSGSIVYDLSVDAATGTLYAGGTFTIGAATNLVALNGTTGAVTRTFSAGKLSSVLFSGGHVYAGGVSLVAYVAATGKKLAGFVAPKAVLDASIRGHANAPAFRDLVDYGGSVVTACVCDSVSRSGSTTLTKALVKVDENTGALQTWSDTGGFAPAGLQPGPNDAAFGLSLFYDAANDALYFGGGGNDYSERFVASSGHSTWKTDTSGSSQAITLFGGNVIVGGHFRWVARMKGQQCGSNDSPNFNCIYQPRIISLDETTGQAPTPVQETQADGGQRWIDRAWGPAVCCAYNGAWVLTPTTNGLWVGGEITKLGTGWSVEAAEAPTPPLKYVLNPSSHGGVGRFS
jgi:hypothetical protein